MTLRTIGVSCYIALIYWASMHVPSMTELFYPTLGAFCFLFMPRSDWRSIAGISLGAFLAALLGTIIYTYIPGVIALIITTLLVMRLIHFLKLNAPPVLAVSFIPFFSKTPGAWEVPLFIGLTLAGLVLLLLAADVVGSRLPASIGRRGEAMEAEM